MCAEEGERPPGLRRAAKALLAAEDAQARALSAAEAAAHAADALNSALAGPKVQVCALSARCLTRLPLCDVRAPDWPRPCLLPASLACRSTLHACMRHAALHSSAHGEHRLVAGMAAGRRHEAEKGCEVPACVCAPQDWLTASEYAVEGMASAKEAGSWSGPDVSIGQQAAAAAKAALIMAEVGRCLIWLHPAA